MACIYFIASIVLTGIVASFVHVDAGTSRRDQPDYHLVPYSGDAWGA